MGMKKINSRRVAAEISHEVIEQSKTLDSVPNSNKGLNGFIGSDRGFARSIASSALKLLGRIHIGISPFLDRPLEATSPEVHALVRVGTTQLWILERPPHSLVYETVVFARQWAAGKRAGEFVNAVSSKINQNRETFYAISV